MIFKPELRDSWELLSLVTSRIEDWAWGHSRKREEAERRPLQGLAYCSCAIEAQGRSRSKTCSFWDTSPFPCSHTATPNSINPLQMAAPEICKVSRGPSETVEQWAVVILPSPQKAAWPEQLSVFPIPSASSAYICMTWKCYLLSMSLKYLSELNPNLRR